MVFNRQGMVLVHNYTKERGKKYHDPNSNQAIQSATPLVLHTDYDGKKILDVAVPVIVSSQKQATARIFFSLDQAYTAVRQTAYNILLIGLLGVIISILLALLLSKIVTGPILDIFKATKKIGQGQRDVRIEIQSDDETGQLAQSFNKMVEDISALEDSIRRSERLAALGMATASLAHKIKTPITSIQTFSEMLPSRYTDARFRTTFQQQVVLEVSHLNQIINELSNYSRERKFSHTETDINHTISNLVSILKDRIKNSEIQIVTQLEKLPLIWADRNQLLEALLIIGENAIEALNQKGQLIIETKLIKGNEQRLRKGFVNEILIIFSDTGKGIAGEHLKKIFEPFFSTKPNSMGLGLAISAKIIEQHQGRIKVQSELGKGTTFEVFLPIKRSDSTSP